MVFIVIFSLFACSKNNDEPTQVVETRSFYMGVTPWPSDFTSTEISNAYNFINSSCDIVSHHFDDGILYEEAFTNSAMPINLVNNVTFRKNNTPANKKILLSVSALDLTRFGKAKYHSDSTVSTSIKNSWEQLPFSSTNVSTAYVNYVSWLIDNFHPNYVNFGVESNSENWTTTNFSDYKTFLTRCYQQLKTKYPSLPFFISFMANENNNAIANAQQLLSVTDYMGLSAYPYISASSTANGDTNPDLLPANYFETYINLAPNKPLVFAETGYTAENVNIAAYSLVRQGAPEWQNAYLNKILKLSNEKKALFVIWFCYKDYDSAIVTLQNMGLYQPIFEFWKDTGFIDQNNNKRPSFYTWEKWISYPKQ